MGRDKVGSKVSGQGYKVRFQGREGHKVFKGTIKNLERAKGMKGFRKLG